MSNSSETNSATTSATTKLAFPVRANLGAWDRLRELGVRLDPSAEATIAKGAFQVIEGEAPSGWEIRDTEVSPMQKRLYDGSDKLVAKLFYKTAGGGGSMHVIMGDDDPMLSDGVIPIFTHKVNTPSAVTPNGLLIISGLRSINDGGASTLMELGARIEKTCMMTHTDVHLPAGWKLCDTTVSPWQKRLYDDTGSLIAQVFMKPLGGAPTMHVFLSEEEARAVG